MSLSLWGHMVTNSSMSPVWGPALFVATGVRCQKDFVSSRSGKRTFSLSVWPSFQDIINHAQNPKDENSSKELKHDKPIVPILYSAKLADCRFYTPAIRLTSVV